MEKLHSFFTDFVDFAAPLLDVYEQAIYLYIARQTLVNDTDEAVIGFKSARKKLAFGVGKAGTPPSEGVVYEKLRSLEKKGFIELVGSERSGTKVRCKMPCDIAGVIPEISSPQDVDFEALDFFADDRLRQAILSRDEHRCFYCHCDLSGNNHVVEHVISRPAGTNSYRNLVAACRQCNNRKGATIAEDFLRQLYREGLLSQDELTNRVSMLGKLGRGELRPVLTGFEIKPQP